MGKKEKSEDAVSIIIDLTKPLKPKSNKRKAPMARKRLSNKSKVQSPDGTTRNKPQKLLSQHLVEDEKQDEFISPSNTRPSCHPQHESLLEPSKLPKPRKNNKRKYLNPASEETEENILKTTKTKTRRSAPNADAPLKALKENVLEPSKTNPNSKRKILKPDIQMKPQLPPNVIWVILTKVPYNISAAKTTTYPNSELAAIPVTMASSPDSLPSKTNLNNLCPSDVFSSTATNTKLVDYDNSTDWIKKEFVDNTDLEDQGQLSPIADEPTVELKFECEEEDPHIKVEPLEDNLKETKSNNLYEGQQRPYTDEPSVELKFECEEDETHINVEPSEDIFKGGESHITDEGQQRPYTDEPSVELKFECEEDETRINVQPSEDIFKGGESHITDGDDCLGHKSVCRRPDTDEPFVELKFECEEDEVNVEPSEDASYLGSVQDQQRPYTDNPTVELTFECEEDETLIKVEPSEDSLKNNEAHKDVHLHGCGSTCTAGCELGSGDEECVYKHMESVDPQTTKDNINSPASSLILEEKKNWLKKQFQELIDSVTTMAELDLLRNLCIQMRQTLDNLRQKTKSEMTIKKIL